MLLFIIITIGASLSKYYFFLYNSLDLGIFNNTLWHTSQGSLFTSSIHPPSYLGDHFAPLLILIAPLYYLISHPYILIVIQTIFLSVSAIPFYLIARRYVSRPWQILLVLAWLFNPFIGSLSLFEFHIVSLLPFSFLLTWYFYINDQARWFYSMLVASLLIREDVAFAMIGMGAIICLSKKESRRTLYYGLTTILISIGWLIASLYVITLFNITESYKFFSYYNWLLVDTSLIRLPIALVAHVATLDVLSLFALIFLPVLFLNLLSPKWVGGLLIAILPLLMSEQGGSPLIPFLHYSAWLLPFVYLGALYGIVTVHKGNSKIALLLQRQQHLLQVAMLVSLVYFFIVLHPASAVLSTTAREFDDLQQKRIDSLILLSYISPDASVIVSDEFFTELSSRDNVHYLKYLYDNRFQFSDTPYDFPSSTDFIILRPADLMRYEQINFNEKRATDHGSALLAHLDSNGYVPYIFLDDAILLKSGSPRAYKFYEETTNIPETAIIHESTTSVDAIEILGWHKPNQVDDHLLLTLYLKKNRETDRPIYFAIHSDGATNTTMYAPPAFGFKPTTSWPNNTIIKTHLLIKASALSDKSKEIFIEPVTILSTQTLTRMATSEMVVTAEKSVGSGVTISY